MCIEQFFEVLGLLIDRSKAAVWEKLRMDGEQEVMGVVAAQAGAGFVGVAVLG